MDRPEGKSKYFTHVEPYLGAIAAWFRNGLTEREICGKLSVSASAFQRYRNAYPELDDLIRENKDFADACVENELFKNCLEREVCEVTTSESPRGSTTRTVRKHVPGNVSAQRFWLMNRKPEQYRAKLDVDARIDGMESIAARMRKLDPSSCGDLFPDELYDSGENENESGDENADSGLEPDGHEHSD